MEFREALRKVKESPLYSRLEGKTLCSAITFSNKKNDFDKWEINYFNSRTGKITRVSVSGEVDVFPEDNAFKDGEVSVVKDDTKIHVSARSALDSALKENDEKYNQPVQKIFIALNGGKEPVWSVNIITKLLSVIQVKVSAETGKILESKTHNLFKGSGVAR